jgi:hypothetical protein
MNPIRAIVVWCALLAAASGAEDQGAPLTPGAGEAQWRPLIDSLASKGTVVAAFTERRFFPFRREPMTLKGVLRISPERGLSLQYTEPEKNVLIADAAGLLLKDRNGRARAMPAGSRETGAIASLLPIMRFDLAALYPLFVIHAQRSGPGWRFEFTPRDPGVTGALGEIAIGGAGSDVRQIEFKRSPSQRVEIEVGETLTGSPFSAADLREFFR